VHLLVKRNFDLNYTKYSTAQTAWIYNSRGYVKQSCLESNILVRCTKYYLKLPQPLHEKLNRFITLRILNTS